MKTRYFVPELQHRTIWVKYWFLRNGRSFYYSVDGEVGELGKKDWDEKIKNGYVREVKEWELVLLI